MKNSYKKGITALEILMVLAVVGILLAIVLPQFSKIKENQILKSTVGDVLSTISKARSQTLASLNSSEYGVHFQSDQVIIFKGTSYSAGASTNVVTSVSAPVSISNVTFGGVSGVSGDVYFSRIFGAPSATGTITISSPTYSKTITISSTGGTNTN
jgi:prepilin-type N-terminal cleavage/methylation domain-containing protein